VSVQRYVTKGGLVRYRARVKFHGREVATQVFERKRDATAWEQDQTRRLRTGEWFDPRRGHVPLREVAADWLLTRTGVKQRTLESDRGCWERYIEPKLGKLPVAAISKADVSVWLGGLMPRIAPSTATRALQTLRLILAHAVADGRVAVNVAAAVRPPRRAAARREGQALTVPDLYELAGAAKGRYAELILVLGLQGLRWGELAGLQVRDVIQVPGAGLRLQRAVLASGGGGGLFVDTLKDHAARTVPLVASVAPIIERWAKDRPNDAWLFPAPKGGPLSESNWKRSVGWSEALTAIGRKVRVHDLRHTAASVWLGSGADPKVVQRVLGHASATMTMDLYGHLIDGNLWQAAKKVGGISGAPKPKNQGKGDGADTGTGV